MNAFRYKIQDVAAARRPITILIGELLEGTLRANDPILIPLRDGTQRKGSIIELCTTGKRYQQISVDEEAITCGVAVWDSSEKINVHSVQTGVVIEGT